MLIAGVAALSAVWWLRPAAGPPLYDGLCAADPYRSEARTTPVQSTITVGSEEPATELATQENPPQASLIVTAGAFPAPAGTVVTLSIKAIDPPAAAPDGTIDGNVYSITATANGRAVALDPNHAAQVILRATGPAGGDRVMEHFDGSSWTRLQTTAEGCGSTNEAQAPQLGSFALVIPGAAGATPGNGGGGPGGSGSGSSVPLIAAAVAALILVIGGGVIANRRRR